MKFQVFFFVWNFGSLFLGPRVCKGSLFHEHWVSIWSRSLFLCFEVSYKLKHCSHSAYDWHKPCLWQIPRPVEILPCPPLATMSPLFSMAAQSPFSILTFKPKNSLFRNFHLIFTFMADSDALFPPPRKCFPFPSIHPNPTLKFYALEGAWVSLYQKCKDSIGNYFVTRNKV